MQMVFSFPLFDEAKLALVYAAPDMPPEYWWMVACIFFILAATAAVDAFTGIVPEALIFLGLLAITAVQGTVVSWDVAAHHLRMAVASGLFIWGVNFAWYKKFDQDAIGMGDAKWTMLAVACFGLDSALIAWGVGSVLATIFLGLFRLYKHRISRVTFSPFLFIGLSVALFGGSLW